MKVTTEEWSLVGPLGVEDRELYHLPTDPSQQRDVIDHHPEVARRLHAAFVDFFLGADGSPERLRLYTEARPRRIPDQDSPIL